MPSSFLMLMAVQKEKQSSQVDALMPGRKESVGEVNVHDVLLGRGPGLSSFPGNLAFRDLCDERREQYTSTRRRKEKRQIAEEVRDEILSRGGRFLKQDFQVDSEGNNVQEGLFIADDDVVLEKCKQTLREKYRHVTESENSDSGRGSEKGGDESAEPTVASSSTVASEAPTMPDSVKRKVSDSSDKPRLPSESAQLSMNKNNSASGPPPFQSEKSPEPTVMPSSAVVSAEVPTARDAGKRKTAPDLPEDSRLRSKSAQLPAMGIYGDCQAPRFQMMLANHTHPVVPMGILPHFSGSALPSMPSYVDPGLAHFQTAVPFAFQQALALKIAQSSLVDGSQGRALPTSMGHLNQSQHAREMILSRAQGLRQAQGLSQAQGMQGWNQTDSAIGMVQSSVNMDDDTPREDSARHTDQEYSGENMSVEDEDMVALPDESVSESFLHLLDMDSRQPRFTDEEEIREKETMSDAEKAAALSDLFGEMCIAPRQTKRCRNDLDNESIQFLIKQMRLELAKIPNAKKSALLQAHVKCRAEEFNDRRLEQFLRCEGMNAELAAQRFVNYWKYRQEVFGDGKYLMRMTLGGALADDLKAIEDGVVVLLPKRDASGRQLVYLEPNRRTEGLYSSESLLRAIWYTMECTSQENTDIRSGYVLVINHAHTTIWNYDRKVYDRFQYYERSCLPVQCISWQACCPNSVTMKVLKPIALALSDRRARLRTLIHDVPENEILNVLQEYGISKDMLPTGVGGDVIIDMPKWMANRRAVELEEI